MMQKRFWLSNKKRESRPLLKLSPSSGTVIVLTVTPLSFHDNPPEAGLEVAVGVTPAVAVTVGVPVLVGVGVICAVAVAVAVAPPVLVAVAVAVAARVALLVGVTRAVAVAVRVGPMPVGVCVWVAVTVPVGPAVPPQKSDDIAARGSPHNGSAREVPSLRATSAPFFHADSRKHCVFLAPTSLYFLLPTKFPGSVKAKPRQPSLGQSTIETSPIVVLFVPLAS